MADERLKVALFTDTYDEVNGVANTFKYLTDYCRRTGRRLDIYAHGADKDSVEELDSVKIFRYKPAIPLEIYFDMSFDLKVPRFRLFRDFKQQGYTLIHTATPGSMGLNALLAARLYKIPLMSSYHTTLPEYVRVRVEKLVEKFHLPTRHSGRRSENITWDFMKWYYDQTRLVLAPSEFTRQQLVEKLSTKVDIFTRGIDTEKFNPRFRSEHDKIRVLYVGRVSTEKNLDTIANAFKDNSFADKAQLVVVGDGPFLEEMKSICPDAEYLGFQKGQALADAYASADLFVFPSTTDTFGNVVLEAMSSGLPVIVTDKMGPKEQVSEGVTGFIAGDDAEFTARIDKLVKDDELRRQMGQNARQYALTRSWDAVFKRLFEQYREVLEEASV